MTNREKIEILVEALEKAEPALWDTNWFIDYARPALNKVREADALKATSPYLNQPLREQSEVTKKQERSS